MIWIARQSSKAMRKRDWHWDGKGECGAGEPTCTGPGERGDGVVSHDQ